MTNRLEVGAVVVVEILVRSFGGVAAENSEDVLSVELAVGR
jgi:hypothetical protein